MGGSIFDGAGLGGFGVPSVGVGDALAFSDGAGDAAPAGRPRPLIIPGMWLRGFRVFPKLFIDSNGVGVEGVMGVAWEEPEVPPFL